MGRFFGGHPRGPNATAKYNSYERRRLRSLKLAPVQTKQAPNPEWRVNNYIVKAQGTTSPFSNYTCECPDFTQNEEGSPAFTDIFHVSRWASILRGRRSWAGSNAGPFNPCKHIMAVKPRQQVYYWRVKNTSLATGDPTIGRQWIIYELKFFNSEGTLISNIDTAFMSPVELSNPAAAFDGSTTGGFTTVTNIQDANTPYNGIGCQSSETVKVIKISNLNNGFNIPPSSYVLEKSINGTNYTTIAGFSTGTNDGVEYTINV